jgi:CxxC motif-containing protein (DUF1111 family)
VLDNRKIQPYSDFLLHHMGIASQKAVRAMHGPGSGGWNRYGG